jgi:hypothetical protein
MGLGIDGALYRNTATHGSPTFDLIDTVSDINVPRSWQRGDGSTRQSPVVMGANTRLDLSITGRIRSDLTNLDFEALWDAWKVQNTLIDVMALTGPSSTNNNYGVRYEANVVDFSEPHGMGDYIFCDFSLLPTVSSNLPDSVEVSTGAPVFTDF